MAKRRSPMNRGDISFRRYRLTSTSLDRAHAIPASRAYDHRSEAPADLIQQRIAVLNFGILDFARVLGNVYNDLRFDNRRQPDSKGMQGIELAAGQWQASEKDSVRSSQLVRGTKFF